MIQKKSVSGQVGMVSTISALDKNYKHWIDDGGEIFVVHSGLMCIHAVDERLPAHLNRALLQPADAVRTTSHATQLDGCELVNIEHTFRLGFGSFSPIVYDVVGTRIPL